MITIEALVSGGQLARELYRDPEETWYMLVPGKI
jgi:hypothetical protein